MEAIGSQVIVMIFPLIALFVGLAYYYRQPILLNINILLGRDMPAPVQPAEVHPLFGEGECSICLEQPKKF